MFNDLFQRDDAPRVLATRVLVFLLASTSFACLLGAFCKLWSMQIFALCVFPPALLLLVFLYRDAKKARHPAAIWILEGALGGIFAAVLYDLFRVPFVLTGFPLFAVFPSSARCCCKHRQPTPARWCNWSAGFIISPMAPRSASYFWRW